MTSSFSSIQPLRCSCKVDPVFLGSPVPLGLHGHTGHVWEAGNPTQPPMPASASPHGLGLLHAQSHSDRTATKGVGPTWKGAETVREGAEPGPLTRGAGAEPVGWLQVLDACWVLAGDVEGGGLRGRRVKPGLTGGLSV